jgi:hypothetical protein
MTSQKNSFVTIAEQVQLLNNNSVEIITKLNDVVTSQDSVVNVEQTDESGNISTYSLPTVGKLQNDINNLNNNIKRLSGLNDNTVHIMEGNSTKKIYLSDLNKEPNRIDTLSTVSTFTSINNWFFESMMNPNISVRFDMTDKVGNDVDGVISRRYIVKFEADSGGTLTANGIISKNDFITKFVNKSDINLKDFTDWYTNTTNVGIINNKVLLYDEQFFSFDYQEVTEHGVFSVISQELDTVNNKFWLHIYPYKYSTINGEEKVLQSGDEVVLNKQDSVTRWKILETSIASSEFRIRVERIEGYDPIPTGTNVLKIYGSTNIKKVVDITVGFNEYLVIFMKPTNSKNKIKGSVWSKGVGLYTNDLVLDTDNNISMSQYYLDTVYDYGVIIKDMVQKTIPSQYALIPNKPNLIDTNFKVVQINKHLTDTPDSQELKDLQSQKNKLKTKLEQVNNAITQKNKELSVKKYSSVAEKNKSQNELSKLIQEQESLTNTLYSITKQIKSKTDTINKSEPKFRIRGFWIIPDAQKQEGSREQEIIQFKIQYRYSSKTGTENQTEGYNVVDGDIQKTAYFSNWSPFVTDIRKRTYNETTNLWEWIIEDVSDADTPNINQLDIPIQQGEKVEIRVKSISEVGYPNSIIESDWSNILTIPFPDDLNDILDENQYILQDATTDNIKIEFEQTLDSKGINKHVNESFYVNEKYVAHTDKNIQTIFKDNNGNSLDLQEYLQYLTNKITQLEDLVYSAKGKFRIFIYDGNSEIEISNNTTTNIEIVAQNFGKTDDGINYYNNTYIISDYYLRIFNDSTADLNFLISEYYLSGNTIRTDIDDLPCLVDKNNDFVVQEDKQFIYFCDNANGKKTYQGKIYHDISYGLYSTNYNYLSDYLSGTTIIPGLSGNYINKNRSTNLSNFAYSALGMTHSSLNDWDNVSGFCSLICPVVDNIDDLRILNRDYKSLLGNNEMIIPFNIYWKFVGDINPTVNITTLDNTEKTKTLRIRTRPLSIDAYFDFNIIFNIKVKNV